MDYAEKKVVGLWRVVVEWGSYEQYEKIEFCVRAKTNKEAWELFCVYWDTMMTEYGEYSVLSTLLAWKDSLLTDSLYTFFTPNIEKERRIQMEYCENEAEAEYEIQKDITAIQTGQYGEYDWYSSTVARKVTIDPQTIITSL